MRRGVCFILLTLFVGVPAAFSQIASIHYAEAFPELCIWVNGIPLVMAEGAESVRVSQWGESPKEGIYDLGYAEYFYDNNYLIRQNGYDADGKQEYSTSYVYENGYVTAIEHDYILYNSNVVYYYNHFEDRTEVYMEEQNTPSESSPEWIKTLRFDSNGYLTKIEADGWSRKLYYDDGFLLRADEEAWGEVTSTIYGYYENGLLESIELEGEYKVSITYDPAGAVSEIRFHPGYQSAVSGKLDVQINERNDLVKIGPTAIEWSYREEGR